jgi:hypothetical protein
MIFATLRSAVSGGQLMTPVVIASATRVPASDGAGRVLVMGGCSGRVGVPRIGVYPQPFGEKGRMARAAAPPTLAT